MNPKRKILIGSVLKPVDDVRMFEKMACDLALDPDNQVMVSGFKSRENIVHDKITTYPIFKFKRISISRWWAKWKFLKLCLKVKPDIIIANTHELLGVMSLYKILFGSSLIYDIQENYYLNIRYGKGFIRPFRALIAHWVRINEKLLSSYIDHFILAEKCYLDELGFIGENYTVIENKFRKNHIAPINITRVNPPVPPFKIVYTGTISTIYGIFDAINFFKLFNKQHPGSTLTIIGYSASQNVLKRLLSAINNDKHIQLIGGNSPVSHTEILKQISISDLALVPYQPNKSYQNRVPTKIYEYLAMEIPMLIRSDLPWVSLCQKYHSCIAVDFKQPNIENITQKLSETTFYRKKPGKEIYWEDESEILRNLVSNIT